MTYKADDELQDLAGIETHWVYRVFDADDVLLYIGCTRRPHTRFQAHKNSSEWYPRATRAEWEPYPSQRLALDAELAAIRTEGSEYNVTPLEIARRAQATRKAAS